MSEAREFRMGRTNYRLRNGQVSWNTRSLGSAWLPEERQTVIELVLAYADMEARSNEYHATAMKQAARIAELEAENADLREWSRYDPYA